ncbi:MAG: hypothetical protein D6767_08680 [Candidatus Hydrogenedentota bacterium]|nr:MAG: hypothetical protein D6767_08680 [Candidatus Hydrogenedentota bacterium]
MKANPLLLCSMGDPAGIGWPILKEIIENKRVYLKEKEQNLLKYFIVVGDLLKSDEKWISRYFEVLPISGKKFTVKELSLFLSKRNPRKQKPIFLALGHNSFELGKPNVHAALRSYIYFKQCLYLWQGLPNCALLTLPVSKEWISKTGKNFTGHTAELSKTYHQNGVMCMHHSKLSIIPLTEHIPIAKVPEAIYQVPYPAIAKALLQLETLKRKKLKIAMLALNPHAGEGGALGKEEDFLREKILFLQKQNLAIEGPFPADSFFMNYKDYDVVLAQYHDQGLIPFKMISGFSGVNITLNLPKMRVSPDHGTAYLQAQKGEYDIKSVLVAMRLAWKWSLAWQQSFSSPSLSP